MAMPSTVIVRSDAADGLTGKGEDVLQQRHALRQIAALVEEMSRAVRAA